MAGVHRFYKAIGRIAVVVVLDPEPVADQHRAREAEVNGPVGVGITVAIDSGRAIRFIANRQRNDATRHHATRQAYTVVVVIDIVIRISRGWVAGAVAQEHATEVGVADDDDIPPFQQLGKGVVTAVDRVAKGDKTIDAGGKVATAVAVTVEFDAYTGPSQSLCC